VRVKKRLGLITLALLTVFVAACSNNGNNGDGEGNSSPPANADSNASVGQQEQASFSYVLPTQHANWLKDENWLPIVEERTNTAVEIVDAGDGDKYYSNMDLRIGGGDFQDASIVKLAQAEVYGSQGAFVDLKPVIEEHGPNIKKFMDDNPELTNLVTSSNGAIYGLIAEYPKIPEIIFYRQDMFAKAGVDTIPQTLDEFTDALRKLKAEYGAGGKFYPLTGRDQFMKFTEVFLAKDSVVDNQVRGIYENGKGFDLYSPNFKQQVEWFKTLYDEKLIDPEWVAGTETEETWQTKMLNSQGAVSYDYYTRPVLFMKNGGNTSDPDFSMTAMPYLKDIDGGQSKATPMFPRFHIDRVLVVNAQSADKAASIIKFLDYFYTDEGQELVTYGLEGESFETVDGEKQYTLDYSEQTLMPIGEMKWNFLSNHLTFPKPVDSEAFYKWNDKLVQDYALQLFTDEYVDSPPTLKYTTQQLQDRTNLLAGIKGPLQAGLVDFVTGKRDMSEWDAFLGEMEAAKYKEVVAIDQAAWDAIQR